MDETLEVKVVPFMGAELTAAKDAKGCIWAGVNWMCRGIGLSKAQRDAQVEKIQTDKVLLRGCRKFPAGVFDANNAVFALALEYVPLWLAKISITPTMAKKHPETAERLTEYQLKAKDVLAAAFLPAGEVLDLGQLSPIMQALVKMEQRQKAQDHAMQNLAYRLALLENPAELTAVVDAIQEATAALKKAASDFCETAVRGKLPHQPADPLWQTRCRGILCRASKKMRISEDLLEEETRRQASVRAEATGENQREAYIEVVNELARRYGV